MSRVVISEFLSLDGVYEEPNWTWQFNRGAEGNAFKLDELVAADALLLGRVTYQGFAAAWPTMEGTGEFGEKMNSMRKYVVSSTLTDAEANWNNTTIITGDVVAQVSKLKAQPGGDVLLEGSGELARTLIKHGLVDEYRLMIFPIVVGKGKHFFGEVSDPARLALMEAKPAGDGIVLLSYQPTS
jgi:dihydrofolate reductase